jgi:hypothetical protein
MHCSTVMDGQDGYTKAEAYLSIFAKEDESLVEGT